MRSERTFTLKLTNERGSHTTLLGALADRMIQQFEDAYLGLFPDTASKEYLDQIATFVHGDFRRTFGDNIDLTVDPNGDLTWRATIPGTIYKVDVKGTVEV